MSEEKTFYERLIDRWQNNRAVAYAALIIGGLLAGIAAYEKFTGFFIGMTDQTSEISAFNETVQPIYFVGRRVELVPGQEEYLTEIASRIIKIQPAAVILRSHTSRIGPGLNVPVSRMRGVYLADFLIHKLGCEYDGQIIAVPRGGLDATEQDDGYEQRVDIELTDNANGIAGTNVQRNPALCR